MTSLAERWKKDPGQFRLVKPPPKKDDDLAEGADDHFYGAWHGGSKASGGGPAGGGPAGGGPAKSAVPLTAAEREQTSGNPDDQSIGPESHIHGYNLKRGGTERMAQMEADGPTTVWNGADSWTKGGQIWEYEGRPGGDTERGIRGVGRAWRDSSLTPESVLIANSAIDAGLTSGMVWPGKNRAMLQPSAASIAITRATYEATQKSLANGPATITLYRGMTEARGTRNALESWTTEPYLARGFGERVLMAEVPREAVFLDHRKVGGESEMVVFGPKVGSVKMGHWVGERDKWLDKGGWTEGEDPSWAKRIRL